MNNLLPLGSLKRDEIYGFIGGLFIACSWHLYFQKADSSSLSDSSKWLTEILFILLWLLSTALLFICQLILMFIITKCVWFDLQKKTPEVLYKMLGFKSPYIFLDYFDNLLSSAHIINIVFLSFLISFYPLMTAILGIIGQQPLCIIGVPFFIICGVLFYFYYTIYRQYLTILQLRATEKLDFIDKKKYCEELAIVAADNAKRTIDELSMGIKNHFIKD